ncbi:hypothetical protein PILCRDRAFT_818377 [Piloderma croceum F 1598]|uniref:Uncharacterized protein n=1 Tax=Piloderma croceum (strain F 1598) TaxID=765440 RepID=A0A0C3FI35_PILCF|nr:hypothetical protein PILCRDRAFT_818377 [Piloderma croceum F 1598]
MSGWFAIAEWRSGKSKVMHPYSAAPARDHAVRLQALTTSTYIRVGQPTSGFAATKSDTWISTVKMQRDIQYKRAKQTGTCMDDRSVVNKDRGQCVHKGLSTHVAVRMCFRKGDIVILHKAAWMIQRTLAKDGVRDRIPL